ncbi:cytochrome c biogenesis protein CcsA [Pseudodesulfovibrio piezophilus]|uniref:Cytochrome c assembly protein domain-containing protein n=1 Tax=Pseudodesulfovibrio piezophilus (strain DSM 21447 / JCM 15486 / C1TLV30) TaxID=1322246 RepID=M1WYC3_PSEP2|nr:cytochrome c biogenesis protein CcsA [Pseudodesulfovibrio piezophilus]CCH50268.1 membrane protein of unknown function [Pseudodesulfovibrio piezophilus C1TLV30]
MSNLLIIHITACSLGYILFMCAFMIACVYIGKERAIKSKRIKLSSSFPFSLNELEQMLFLSLSIGFAFLSLGIPLGVLAQKAMYGSVNLTSIRLILPSAIWLFYLLIFIFRSLTGVRGKTTAYMAVYGFNCTAFSFLIEMLLAHGS